MKYLLEAYKKLNKLYESKSDQEGFINKFGKNYFDLFVKFKDSLKNRNISADMVWHTKHTSVEDMKELLDNLNNKVVIDNNGKSKLNRRKVFEDTNFIVWEILDWETAMNMGEGASWCIAGRYQTKEPKSSQAEYYFNEYLKTTYSNYYYVIAKVNNRKWCICKRKDNTIDIWSQEDKAIATRSKGLGIESLPTIKEIEYFVEDYNSFKQVVETKTPAQELAEEFLNSEVEYNERSGAWESVSSGDTCYVDDIDSAKDEWFNYLSEIWKSRSSQNNSYFKIFNDEISLYNENIKKDLVLRPLEEIIYSLDDEELKQLCTTDNEEAFDKIFSTNYYLKHKSTIYPCEAIKTIVRSYIWTDKSSQERLNDVDYLKDRLTVSCNTYINMLKSKRKSWANSWLDVAMDIQDVDTISEIFKNYDNACTYINFEAYWDNYLNYGLRMLYYEFILSDDGQLVAHI